MKAVAERGDENNRLFAKERNAIFGLQVFSLSISVIFCKTVFEVMERQLLDDIITSILFTNNCVST